MGQQKSLRSATCDDVSSDWDQVRVWSVTASRSVCVVSVLVHTYRCADTCPAFTVSTRVQQASDGLNHTHVLSIVTHEWRGSRGQEATSVLSTFFHLVVKFACHYFRHVTSTRLVNCLVKYLMTVTKSRFYHSHCFCSPLFSSVYFFHLFLFSPFDWVFFYL